MTTAPTFTIVTPSFNRLWSLPATVASIRAQTGVALRHLVMDGGSTDGTVAYLEKLRREDSRCSFVVERDEGMYFAVANGLDRADGDVFAYLNTDDFYLPGALEKVARVFASDPTVDMVYGQWASWHPESGFVEILPVPRYSPQDLLEFAVLPQPAVFVRTAVARSIGGLDTRYRYLADNEFFARAALSSRRIVRLEAVLAMQTVHGSNLLVSNQDASHAALLEGLRYREQLRSRHQGDRRVRSADRLAARAKRILLPIGWRLRALHAIGTALARPRTSVWAPLVRSGNLSPVALIRYLCSRHPRDRHVYLRCTASRLGEFLGHEPPVIPS